jgi:hypothetical protein
MDTTWTVEYVPEDDAVVTIARGTISSAHFRQFLEKQAQVAKEHGCARFLTDITDAAPSATYYELFRLPKICEDAGLSKSGRHALVASQNAELYLFVENVLSNAGCTVRVFRSRAEAKEWLAAD